MTRSLLERTAALPASAYHLTKAAHAALMEHAAQIRQDLAAKRAKKLDERRTGQLDRRGMERRNQGPTDRRTFATMDDKLAAVADKRDKGQARFDGGPPSGFLPFGDS